MNAASAHRPCGTELLLAVTLCLLPSAALPATSDPLADGFRRPPATARPHTWWHWMNGNISRAGITADLEAMQRLGLGGVQIFNVNTGLPAGPVGFMSPDWHQLFKFALAEADRLDLEVGVHNCAGWSASGGPWISPAQAMQRIVSSEILVKGPAHFDGLLPSPPIQRDYYRDITVLAFRRPPGECIRLADSSPKATASGPGDAGSAIDGRPGTIFDLPPARDGQPRHLTIECARPYQAQTIRLHLAARPAPGFSGSVQVSDDGVTFRSVLALSAGWQAGVQLTFGLPSPVTARFWRLHFDRTNDTGLRISELELLRNVIGDDFEARAALNGLPVRVSPTPDVAAADCVQPAGTLDLTSRMQSDGRLVWDAPEGDWIVLRVGHTPTGRTNVNPAEGGRGLECDKLSRAALDAHWAGAMRELLEDAGTLAGRTLTNALIDSWEVGGQNWTSEFPQEFRRRRGYDLHPFLPAFTGRTVGSAETTGRFLWDVRRTIADMVAENYFGYFSELCRKHGLKSAAEPYGGPFESLQAGATSDLVMGEYWMWDVDSGAENLKLVASMAHIHGRPVVAAEAFTAAPPRGRWLENPQSLKATGDRAFCRGVNQNVLHSFVHQPWPGRMPGLTLAQFGTHFAHPTWLDQGAAWIDYLSRCQFLLQQGRFVADVAYFAGEDAPVGMRPLHLRPPSGYDYDGVGAGVLHSASVHDGRLVLASGMSYAVLVLPPGGANLRPAVLRDIRRLVDAGATVVGPRPERSPSLEDFPACDEEIRRLAAELWGDCDGANVREHAFGKGRVIWGRPLTEVFAGLDLPPDVAFPAGTRKELASIHRSTADAEIYFVASADRSPRSGELVFRVSGRQPELWHPDTGRITKAPVWREHDGRTTVSLEFEPQGSVFVVFRDAVPSDHVVEFRRTAPAVLGSDDSANLVATAWAPGRFEARLASGRTMATQVGSVPEPLALEGPWEVMFPPGRGAPARLGLSRLASLSDHPAPGVRHFSGTAVYTTEFDLPAGYSGPDRVVRLDLGMVKDIVNVRLNGRDLGTLWKTPFVVDVTTAARTGRNVLELFVTNSWTNRLIGDEQLPPDCEWNPNGSLKAWPQWLLDGQPSPTGRVTFTTWRHWTKDSPLPESGLLGPVRLMAGERRVITPNQGSLP